MELDTFIIELEYTIYDFKAHWKTLNALNPIRYPLTMKEEDWLREFADYANFVEVD